MKKIVACFLVMAIAVGCSQSPRKSEKPIDSPVEKQPDIGDTSDFVLSTFSMIEINEIAAKYPDALGKKDVGLPYLITKEVRKSSNENHSDIILNTSTNELFNWMTSIDLNSYYNENLELNLKGEFPEYFNQRLERFINPTEKEFVSHSISGRTEETSEILSVILRFRTSASGNTHFNQTITSYNFDLSSNKPITNNKLLMKYGFTIEEAQTIVYEQLAEAEVLPYSETINSNVYYSEPFDGMNMHMLYSSKLCAEISEDSVLYLNDEGRLNMLVFINDSSHIEYEGNITNYFIVKF